MVVPQYDIQATVYYLMRDICFPLDVNFEVLAGRPTILTSNEWSKYYSVSN